MIKEQYYVVIHCEAPHSRFNRRVPFNWQPDHTEIWNCVRRLRDQAKKAGVEQPVAIKYIVIQKLDTVEEIDPNIQFRSSSETTQWTSES